MVFGFKLPETGNKPVVIEREMRRNELAYKYPDDTIPMGSVVVVRPGQVAVFVRDGKIYGVLEEGRHVLTTANLPFLDNLIEKIPLAGGLKEMFKAEVYFVSTVEHEGNFGESAYAGGKLPVMVRGNYKYRIKDAEVFIGRFVGSYGGVVEERHVEDFFKENVTSAIQQFMGTLTPKQFTNTLEVNSKVRLIISEQFQRVGIEVMDVNVVVEVDEAYKNILFYIQSANTDDWNQLMDVMRMHTLQQMAQNLSQGGGAGAAGVGLGMGMMLPYMMMPGYGYGAPMVAGGYVQPQQQTMPQQPIQQKQCPNCGRMIPADAKLCPYCGYRFG